jgi:chromosome segregation ATPase
LKDFDVEMVNIGAFWKTSETMINEYNEQQNQLRAKQQMLKEDWERFKAQRKALEKQIRNSSKEQEPPNG